MSEVEREPARPEDEAETPREARGSSRYAVTIAALEAALAEALPVDDGADALLSMEV